MFGSIAEDGSLGIHNKSHVYFRLGTRVPYTWVLPAVPQVAFATVIPSAFIVSGRGKGLVGGQVVAPECGATLGCRYLMPHVAFSVAIVAK